MQNVIEQIRGELKAAADKKTQQSIQRFFKEKVAAYGAKSSTVGKIAKKFWPQVENLGKQQVFGLCEELFGSGTMEEAFVVANWLPNYVEHFVKSDLTTFEGWIERYIDNWAKCDSFCNHTIGDFIAKYPECVCELTGWAKSENRWLKRAAAVSLIVPAKKGEFLKETLEICDLLLTDGDDMVQKGYGWLLKEESRKHQNQIFEYVMRNKNAMSRTALRYSIELMPQTLKVKAMKKPN